MANVSTKQYFLRQTPLLIAFAGLLIGGSLLLDRAASQARDTTRKHHLEDLEHALYLARTLHGTYPPYDQPQWCGPLEDPAHRPVRNQIEAALRQDNEKYENPAKPFPTDPLPGHDYFYWKQSPASFELYSILEADDNNNRTTTDCAAAPSLTYDYGLTSVHRNHR